MSSAKPVSFTVKLCPRKSQTISPVACFSSRPSATGFGYHFNSLESAAAGREEESELATAFAIIFDSARKFRVMTILQVWFPILRKFVGP